MRHKWLILWGAALCALAFVILGSQAASQAQTLTSDRVISKAASSLAIAQGESILNTETLTTTVFLPNIPRGVRVLPPILLQDTFDSNADQWTPFVNGDHLSYAQWYWQGGVGREGGAYNHAQSRDPSKEAHDALSMYLGTGSEQWTNYRYEAWVWFSPFSGGRTTASLWFRGHYQEVEEDNQWVLGYYFNVAPGKEVAFWQNQTPDDCIDDTCTHPDWQYNFENPMELSRQPYDFGTGWLGKWHKLAVEVRGDEGQGVHMKGFIDDNLAIEFVDTAGTVIPNGTVGLGAYRAPLLRFDDIQVTPLD